MPLTSRSVSIAVLSVLGIGNELVFAQIDKASVVGRIQDATGAAAAGAVVQMRNLSTNQALTTTTTSTGDYTIVNLPADTYRIEVSSAGFKTESVTSVKLDIGRTYRFDFTLAVGDLAERIEVQGVAPLINTETPEFGHVIQTGKVVGLPLAARDFLGLAALVPGVAPSRGSLGGGGANAYGFNIRGQRRSDNIIYVDGGMMTDSNGAMQFFPSPDALQEFDIKTGLYSAEFGIKPGGQINSLIKSGTNQLHFVAFEFLRNNKLDARNYFDPGPRPPFKRNQFGTVFSGPIYLPKVFNGKNKAFFLFSYAGERRRDFQSLTAIVPTAAEKSGRFSQTIIDPNTRAPFPNNTIPENRFDPVAKTLLQFWPDPNSSGVGFNFTSPNSSAPFTGNQYIAKVDYLASPNDRWSARFIYDYKPLYNSNPFQVFASFEPLITWAQSITNVRTFKSRIVNDFSIHFLRNLDKFGKAPFNEGFGFKLGIPGYPLAAVDENGVPRVGVTGLTTIGDFSAEGWVPVGNWEVRDNVSLNWRAHSFKIGYHWRRNYNFFASNRRSTINFDQRYTGNPFASYLLGLVANANLGAEANRGRFGQNSSYFFFQDDWKISSRLTASLGLRYELRGPWKDRRGFMSNFNPSTGLLYPDLQNLQLKPWETGRFIPDYPLIEWSKLAFLPRIGVAYRLQSKTVIRAGYGMFSNEPSVGMVQNLGVNPRPNAAQKSFLADPTTPNIFLSNAFTPSVAVAGAALPNLAGIENPLPLSINHSWGLSIQRQLTPTIAVEAGYQGAETQHDLQVTQVNDATPGTAPRQQRRPYPNYQSVTVVQANGTSSYNGLELKMEKRAASDGLSLLLAYTWAKSIDTVGGRLGVPGEPTGISRNLTLKNNRGLGEANIPSRFVATLGYELPFGKGKQFFTGTAAKFLGGWTVQTVLALQKGPFITPIMPADTLDVGSTASFRPDLLRNPALPSGERSPQRWFDTAAFAAPRPFQYGTSGRSVIQAPGIVQLDSSLLRTFAVSEGARLEFRFEAFNAINHTNFLLPGTSFGTPTFGVIGSAFPGRSLQFGLKFYF